MVKKFLIWTYRTDFKTTWVKKYQWIYLAFGFLIFLPLAINRFVHWTPETNFLTTLYWSALSLINLNTVYILVDIRYGKKIISDYYEKLITYDKVICCWEDDILEKGKVYEIEDFPYNLPSFKFDFGNKQLKGTSFLLSKINYKILKLVSLKEQRRLKLEKIGK